MSIYKLHINLIWKILVSILFLHLHVLNCNSQNTISLEECIITALESNYDIKIVRNNARIANNNVNYSPFLPSLNLNASQNQSRNNTKTESNTGIVNKNSDARTDNYSAGVALNWRLFDGLEMFTTHERYKELAAMSDLALQQTIEGMMYQVSYAYFNVIVQKHMLLAAKHSLDISNERYDEAQVRYEIKNLSGLDLQQAKIDLNSDSSNYVRQKEALKSAYINLNKLMNTNLQMEGYVQDTILLMPLMDRLLLEEFTQNNNTTLQIARKDQRISALDLKNAKAILFPTVDFNTGYNYNKTDSPASNTVLNRTNGFYWGFSMSMPIFNKLQNRTRIKNAQIDLENTEYSYLQAELEIMADLALLYNTYENNLLMVNFEQESAIVAEANLDAALEKYKLGSLSGIEFREFQRSYIDAVDRMLSAIFQAKASELSLLLISGNILSMDV